MKENLVNTGGCIQNNCLDVFCITVHCIIKVSDPGPSWPSCLTKYVQSHLLQNCRMRERVNRRSLNYAFLVSINLFPYNYIKSSVECKMSG